MGDGIGDMAFWLAMGFVGLGFFFGPVGRALGRWIESKSLPTGPSPELNNRLAEFDHMAGRMAELEERLDFAERLLAQQREPQRLGAEGRQ